MNRFLALAALLAAAPAAGAERSYSVTDFDRIVVEGPYQVTVATGGFSRARVIGDTAAIDRITVEVQGRTLKIRANRSAWGGYPGAKTGTARIEISTRDVVMASVIGAGSLSIDRTKGLKIDLTVSGSGRLSVAAVDADNLVVGLVGSGAVSAGGKAKQMRATIQGSGNFEAEGLAVDDAVLFADTAGRIAFEARRTAKVTASGPGEVNVAGDASCTVTGPAEGGVVCGR